MVGWLGAVVDFFSLPMFSSLKHACKSVLGVCTNSQAKISVAVLGQHWLFALFSVSPVL